jgi:hypothetical protein
MSILDLGKNLSAKRALANPAVPAADGAVIAQVPPTA